MGCAVGMIPAIPDPPTPSRLADWAGGQSTATAHAARDQAAEQACATPIARKVAQCACRNAKIVSHDNVMGGDSAIMSTPSPSNRLSVAWGRWGGNLI